MAFGSDEKPYRIGDSIEFNGYVDDFENNIAAIQFSLDDGGTWTTYEVSKAAPDKGVNWHFSYTPEQAGLYLLKVRAVDGKGGTAPVTSGFAFEVLP